MISESDVDRNETPALAQRRVQLDRVDQVAVVRERDLAAIGAPDGLRVLPRRRAGGRVADVAHRHVALQGAQLLLVEDLVDEPLVAHRHDVAALGGRDARGLLPAMLERVEREVASAARHRDRARICRTPRTRRAVPRDRRGTPRRASRATAPASAAPATATSAVPARRQPEYAPRPRVPQELIPHGRQRPPTQIDRQRIKELIEREEKALNDRDAQVGGDVQARGTPCSAAASPPPTSCATRGRSTSSAASARRSGTSTATRCTTSTTGSARWSRATPTRLIGKAIQERYNLGTHFAAPTEDADRGRRGAAAPLEPAALALHELRLRVDDGRHPDRARVHEPRHRDEDLRLLPRPPRHGDGLDRRRVRQDRRPRQPRLAALRRRHPAGRRGHDDRRAVQRRRRDGAPHRAPHRGGPQARLRDHGGGDDEPRDRAPRAGLPRGRPRDHAAPRHRPDLRRGQDRPDDRRRRRDRALRRPAGHGHARQVARRRHADGRDRRHRGGHDGRRGRLRLPGRHVQREPAGRGRHAREPARGPHARGLRAPRPPQRPHRPPAARP